jgi:hypothetical protein
MDQSASQVGAIIFSHGQEFALHIKYYSDNEIIPLLHPIKMSVVM